jgi:hypothetical protein
MTYSEGMLEKTPAPDNLYDDTGRVKDVDAAQEMAQVEQHYRDVDEDRLFRPGRKELARRGADAEFVGQKALAEKRERLDAQETWDLRQETEKARRLEFIDRSLQQHGLSTAAWLSLPVDERARLERGWVRAEQQSPEWMLEQRLNSLVGRKINSFNVGDFGEVEVNLDDGFVLSFQSWDMRNDTPDYDGVQVRKTARKDRRNEV